MRKRILAYLDYIDKILANDIPVTSSFDAGKSHPVSNKKDIIPTRKEYESLLKHHLDQIAFFQHERLVHLIVTVLFAILAFAVFITCLFSFSFPLLGLLICILVLLVPYIMHYYLLENSVQKMYVQYDEIVKKML